jgi:hypothetical protein
MPRARFTLYEKGARMSKRARKKHARRKKAGNHGKRPGN